MMQPWFEDAKLGIFIHWGIYAVKGIAESWSFFNKQVSYEDYMSQLSDFTAAKYDPRQWAELFKRAGARYAVLTTKHHDGVALWDTQENDLNVVQRTPAARDLVTPFVDAMRGAGLHAGLYYSHLDWSHPDYASVLNSSRRPGGKDEKLERNPFAYPAEGAAEQPERWQRFLAFHRAQLKELCTRYHPDLLWFDGDWERDADQWNMGELREQLHAWAGPQVILNSRMRGHGDYATPEQGVPIVAPKGPWEFCVTMNNSWAYKYDEPYKPAWMLVRLFAECIGMGGNMLLNCAPNKEGVIVPEQVERLEVLGDWIRKHEEAVYGSIAGLPHGHTYGPSTMNKATNVLYIMTFDRPTHAISVKGVRNKVLRATVLGTHQEVRHEKVGGA
ncbi:MAG TPA: alpha-L-fucosidase, partial [Tepidisphaeraceae bacterium]